MEQYAVADRAWGKDPFEKALRAGEHPLVWCLEDVLRGKETDVSSD